MFVTSCHAQEVVNPGEKISSAVDGVFQVTGEGGLLVESVRRKNEKNSAVKPVRVTVASSKVVHQGF